MSKIESKIPKPPTEKKRSMPSHRLKALKDLDMTQDLVAQIGKIESQLLQHLYQVTMVMSMKELAEVLHVAHSRISHVMDNLVMRKLVFRRPSAEDRRCWYAEITEYGKQIAVLIQESSK